jgi:hypothetical protein
MIELFKYIFVETALSTIREFLGFRKTEIELATCETTLSVCESCKRFYRTAFLVAFIVAVFLWVGFRGSRIA